VCGRVEVELVDAVDQRDGVGGKVHVLGLDLEGRALDDDLGAAFQVAPE
jgi:hypothetical protein